MRCDAEERGEAGRRCYAFGFGFGRGINAPTSLHVLFIDTCIQYSIKQKMNYGSSDEEDDLRLVKASATLLAELEQDLPKLLWKTRKPEHRQRRVHTQIRRRDLDRITSLV